MKKYRLKEIGPHSQGRRFFLDNIEGIKVIKDPRPYDKVYEVCFSRTDGVCGYLFECVEEWRDEDGYHKEEHWFFLPKFQFNNDVAYIDFSINLPTEALEKHDVVSWNFGEGRADMVSLVFDGRYADCALLNGNIVGEYQETNLKVEDLLLIATKSPDVLALLEHKEYIDYSTNNDGDFVNVIKEVTFSL